MIALLQFSVIFIKCYFQIVRRYDILLIQEVRDSSGKAFISLMEHVNR